MPDVVYRKNVFGSKKSSRKMLYLSMKVEEKTKGFDKKLSKHDIPNIKHTKNRTHTILVSQKKSYKPFNSSIVSTQSQLSFRS